jgi:hypothetical protein
MKFGAHVGYVLLVTRKATDGCEVFSVKLVLHTFVVSFEMHEKHQTEVRYFLLSFFLINVYKLGKPYFNTLKCS